jgi:hypothetical protein
MKQIPLSGGKVAIIDDADFGLVSAYNWYYTQCKKIGYARTNRVRDGVRVYIYMHTLIMPHPPGMHTDHISQDTLDNRRSNLRVCTHAQNLHNCGPRKNNHCGYVGVIREGNKWAFKSTTNGVLVRKGRFFTAKAAALAYDAHVRSARGDFAHTNFPL